jgi:hypothetical protein
MKKRNFAYGLLAAVVALGLLFAGCGGNEPVSLLPSTVGELIITGIPAAENGKYACMRASYEPGGGGTAVQLFGMADSFEEGTFIGVQINAGAVTIPVYLVNEDTLVSYTGSHTVDACIVTKADSSFNVMSEVVSGGHQLGASVTFSSGKATASW